ncbi:bifunctional DedA family/phosphatase PAP2 family protein [Salinicola avicenniae]|uniref:bifunctional DedA family/phosphatase PAP2 family protein n=1 Tax=Salinicola avicenniae TaxID=2916836 RepID=UPI0020746A3A|nr:MULTISPECIES: bifunctional DedA family/phosphatase PAP2 family protein [unclassified Salinicola]
MNVTDWLYSLGASPGWMALIIFGLALIESLAIIGIVVPGVAMLGAAASVAGHANLAIWIMLLAGASGAFVGDNLSFWLGRTQRTRLPRCWPLRRHPEWLERGTAFFQRYGLLSVVIGRFVGPVRPFVPMVAGMLSMPTRRFTLINAVSALAWAPVYLLPGYWLGRSWTEIAQLPAGTERWLVALSLSLLLLGVIFSWFRYQLSGDGRLHRWLDSRLDGGGWLAGLWRGLSSPAPDREFPLASLSLLFTSLIALIAWTTWVLLHHGPLPMDQQIHSLAAMLQQRWLVGTSETLAEVGDAFGIGVLMAPWLLWLLWARRFAALLHIGGALVTIAVANTVFKALAGRTRPDTPDYLTGSMSYPSAHTSTIVVVVGLTAAFAAQALPQRYRAYAYWSGILLCAPMALSRLVIGVHWASDLIGGALLGLVVCALARISYQRFQRPDRDMPPWLALAATSLLLIVARVIWFAPV